MVEAIQRIAVEPKFPATSVHPFVVLDPLLFVVMPCWVLRLRGEEVEVVGKEGAAVLARHLQDLGSLFCQPSRAVLLEVFEHHAVGDKLTDE